MTPKQLSKERLTYLDSLNTATDKLQDAIYTFNNVLLGARDNLTTEIQAYNDAIAEANEWRNNIAAELEDYYNDRSDKWRASEKGEAYYEWMSSWQGEFEEAEVELPDDILIDVFAVSELEELTDSYDA